MHQRAALSAREHHGVEFLVQVGMRPRQDQAAPGTAQGLVRGRGHHIRERHRVWIQARRDQACDVRHVHEQVGADRIGDGPEARPIDDARIGGKSGHDHFWTMLLRQTLDLIVIDDAGIGDESVLNRLEEFTREIDLGPMGQVTAMIEAHSQNGVAGIEQREIHRGICLGSGMGLHVRVSRAKQLLRALDRQALGNIDEFAAAVVALSRDSPRRTCWSAPSPAPRVPAGLRSSPRR